MLFRTTALIPILFLATGAHASLYDTTVLRDRPVLYWKMTGSATESDLSGLGHGGKYFPPTRLPGKTTMPNGDTATVFDGVAQFLEAPSASVFSVPARGGLTIEAWLRPDTLQFVHDEGDGYVYWAGKGESGEHEYAGRMYSRTNDAHRPNRVSGYVFNLSGGLGSGSYFQDPLTAGQWFHVAIVVDTRGEGTVALYKNGVLRKTTPLRQFGVTPRPGNAPLRVATRDLRSFFKGAVGKFAIYRKALGAAQLLVHYRKMTAP